ncbi:MAG: hypothetical protein U1F77_05265 [Kiritimatiellia bacterium]
MISREINLTRLHIRVGKDVNQKPPGSPDVLVMAGKRSDAARVKCALAE